MADIKLAPGLWRTRDTRKINIIGRGSDNLWVGEFIGDLRVGRWHENGVFKPCYTSQDIIAPWRDPVRGEAWAVAYDSYHIIFGDKGLATNRAERDAKIGARLVRVIYNEVAD